MANEVLKELKTKIALKTLPLLGENSWESIKDTYKPLKGEVCICEIPQDNANATTAPTILFKVGDGTSTWGQLKWASALAADVYDWAKKPQAEFITWVNTVVEHPAAPVITTGNGNGTIAVDGTDVAVKGLGSAAYTNADAYATSTENGAKQAAADAQKTIDDYAVAHKDDYTNKQIDDAIAAVDTGVHAVDLATGDANGQVKLTVDGESKNVDVKGLASAAYVTVESLNTTAKGYADAVEAKLPTSANYGVLDVTAGTSIEVTGDAQHPVVGVKANTYDAYGAAEAVLGTSADAATANTVYGAKAAAAAAQSDATIAKTKIETFLGTVTPDGSQDIIDTLTEINNYVGEHGEEFASLSEKVTKIENGTTTTTANAVTQDLEETIKGWTIGGAIWAETAENAEKFGGQEPSYYATAEALNQAVANVPSTKVNNAVHADTAAKATDADNATKAADADKFGGQLPSYYATAEALNTVSEAANDAKTHATTNAGLIQGNTNRIKALEDASHISEVTTTENGGLKVTNKNQIDIDDEVVFVLNCNW